jgi:antitoxin MazE
MYKPSRGEIMRVEVQKWGNSAAIRVPAPALKDAGMQVGQSLELRVEDGKLVLEPATESLDELVARITPQNSHSLALDGPAVGAEVW